LVLVRLDDPPDLFALRIGQSKTLETHRTKDAHRSARPAHAARPTRSAEAAVRPAASTRPSRSGAPSAGSGVLTAILSVGENRHGRCRQGDGQCRRAETKPDS